MENWRSAEAYFERRGGVAIYLTHCLLTPIAVPTNWIAGSSGYRPLRFVAYAAAGELTWLLVYGGLGYLFGSQWEAVSTFISDFSSLLVGLVLLVGGVYWWLRRDWGLGIGQYVPDPQISIHSVRFLFFWRRDVYNAAKSAICV